MTTSLPVPPAVVGPVDSTHSDTASLLALAHHSHDVIAREQDPGGAYPAAPTFSAYAGYCWLRDGGFTAEGMSRYGDVGSADRFHGWVDRTLAARRAQVDGLLADVRAGVPVAVDRMLPTRFTYTGTDGTDPWWDFQTDGYGTWLWSAVTHAERHAGDLERWRSGVEVAVDFVAAFADRACFDWWEEHAEQRHVSTLGAVVGGLETVVRTGLLDTARSERCARVVDTLRGLVLGQGVRDGHLTKWLGTDAVDGSLSACVVPFGLVPVGSPAATATLAAVARDLEVDGGVHRFRADVFYGGGRWPLLTAFLGWNRAVAGDRDGAWRALRWMAAQAAANGDLPEQVSDVLRHPEHLTEWQDRWGPVATPLLWSHGMYLVLAAELGVTA